MKLYVENFKKKKLELEDDDRWNLSRPGILIMAADSLITIKAL